MTFPHRRRLFDITTTTISSRASRAAPGGTLAPDHAEQQ